MSPFPTISPLLGRVGRVCPPSSPPAQKQPACGRGEDSRDPAPKRPLDWRVNWFDCLRHDGLGNGSRRQCWRFGGWFRRRRYGYHKLAVFRVRQNRRWWWRFRLGRLHGIIVPRLKCGLVLLPPHPHVCTEFIVGVVALDQPLVGPGPCFIAELFAGDRNPHRGDSRKCRTRDHAQPYSLPLSDDFSLVPVLQKEILGQQWNHGCLTGPLEMFREPEAAAGTVGVPIRTDQPCDGFCVVETKENNLSTGSAYIRGSYGLCFSILAIPQIVCCGISQNFNDNIAVLRSNYAQIYCFEVCINYINNNLFLLCPRVCNPK